MGRALKILIAVSLAVTAAALVAWRATGGDYYTKFEVVEQVDAAVKQDDPLAGTGFYDDATQTQTIVRPAFRFGLLPTPQGALDKHALSVASLALPFWAATAALFIFSRLRRRSPPPGAE
ncbi:MAG: hypothetical protein HY770_05905 [Chitinivibrionia bacterium]|nr:hypothetical protein [Chitinivibrionia bacterium]